MEPERGWTLESLVAETRADVKILQADVKHLQADVTDLRTDMRDLRTDMRDLGTELRTDIRRLDGRVDQLLLVQLATLLTAAGSLATALVTALG